MGKRRKTTGGVDSLRQMWINRSAAARLVDGLTA